MPTSACFRTTARTDSWTRRARFSSSYGSPESLAASMGIRSPGRGRLPTCVVRMRFVLRCMVFPEEILARGLVLAKVLHGELAVAVQPVEKVHGGIPGHLRRCPVDCF